MKVSDSFWNLSCKGLWVLWEQTVSMFNSALLRSFSLVYVPNDRGGPSHLQPSKQKKIALMAEQRADNQRPAGIILWEPWMSSQIYVSLLWADAEVTYLLVWTVGGIRPQGREEEKISYVTGRPIIQPESSFLFKSLFPIMNPKMCGVSIYNVWTLLEWLQPLRGHDKKLWNIYC